MKALSIRQPWAELIVSGRKTLELRSWRVNYRGPVAIHAGQTVDRGACQALGLDPDQVTAGAVVGVVELADVEALDVETYAARRGEHLAKGAFKPPLYGWRLQNPQRYADPRPMPGRMGLFEIADTASATTGKAPKAPQQEKKLPQSQGLKPLTPEGQAPADRPFELRVVAAGPTAQPAGEATYSLALYQEWLPGRKTGLTYGAASGDTAQRVRVAELGGPALRAVTDQVLDALRHAGYKVTDLSASRREPFRLSEEAGLRLGLLFLAVKPITKLGRVEAIADGLRGMASEEAYYWYSKCTTALTADRALKALRILLSED